MVCIDDSERFLKVFLSSSRFSFLVNLGAFSWCFSRSDFEAFLSTVCWGIEEPIRKTREGGVNGSR
jgi:hypothetical protein